MYTPGRNNLFAEVDVKLGFDGLNCPVTAHRVDMGYGRLLLNKNLNCKVDDVLCKMVILLDSS